MAAGAGLDEGVEAGRAHLVHGRFQVDQVLLQAGVAAGLEQVGADGDGAEARRHQVREVARVGAAAEADGHLAVELLGDQGGQGERERMQGATRQIHHLFVRGEHGPVVHHLEGVGELEAEAVRATLGHLGQGLDHGHGVRPLGVVAESLVRHGDVEAQGVIEQAPQPLRAEQGGVQLHPGVHAHVREQEPGDALDLRRGAAVHGGEGDLVGQLGGDGDVAHARIDLGHRRDGGLQGRAGVAHIRDELLHPGVLDALQVVAHAHAEVGARILEPQLVGQGVDEHPGIEVLREGLFELELLGPLAVVGLVRRIDAGAAHLDLVEDLDRL